MTVTREQLEAHLAKIQARVKDPRHGLYGPDSLMWKINRESVNFLAGGRAVLLQEAHPYVAHGVDQHSLTRADPLGRAERTFRNVNAMVFGDLDRAFKASRRVFTIHDRIKGHLGASGGKYGTGAEYAANTEHALMWVNATLWESSVRVYELIFRPLSAQEKEQYYQESKLFAYLFGITDDVLPRTWPDFIAYNEYMWNSNELHVTDAARKMSRFLLAAPKPSLEKVASWYRVMTAALMPPRLREDFGFTYGARERAIFEASVLALKGGVRLLPRSVRYAPAYQKARVRIGLPIVPTLTERLFAEHVLPFTEQMLPGTAKAA